MKENLEKSPDQTEEGFPKVNTKNGVMGTEDSVKAASRLEGLTDERDILAAVRYHPRGDMVLLREVKRGTLGSLSMPDISADSKDYWVIAVGPDVSDIKPGMSVFIIGRQGYEWGYGLFMLRAVNIPLIEVKPK